MKKGAGTWFCSLVVDCMETDPSKKGVVSKKSSIRHNTSLSLEEQDISIKNYRVEK